MGSYVPTTAAEREQMLAQVGVKSLNDLYAAVPQEMFLHDGLNLPEGLSELEVREKVTGLAEKNKVFKTVLRGAGSYRHFIPAVVKSITSREELVTCYTPYQAEISQGVLQGTFEFQTMICELTGMDVANASHYDGATAAAETIPAETTTVPEAGADTSEYAAAAKTLFGALNYIDQIGSGNLPKDETDTIQTTKSGVTYERVTKTQFSSTADLKAYMTASLTQKMIDSRYAAILGTNKPLYIDANGGLYGRQYATSGGFTWIDPEQVTISNATDSSFTASMQYDNFGAADTLTVQIVLDNGLWKIDSMQ